MLLILNNAVSQATFGYLLFTVQHLWELGGTCHAVGHQVLPSTFYHECYGYERVFFTLRRFLPDTPCCWFQGFPGASSSTTWGFLWIKGSTAMEPAFYWFWTYILKSPCVSSRLSWRSDRRVLWVVIDG